VIFNLISQYVQASGAAGLLWVFLVLHLCAGLILPYRPGAKPFFFRLVEIIGLDLEARLNRETRRQSARFIRGLIVTAFLGWGGYLVGAAVRYLMALPHGWLAGLFFLSLCVNFMAPLKLVRRIIHYLKNNETAAVATALQPYLKAPLDKADAHTLTRKTIEFIVFSLTLFLTAPAFWFVAAGPVGLSLYITCAALNQAFGLPDERRRYFGRGVRSIDTLLNMVPALLAALLLCVSALFVSKSNPLRAVATLLRQGWADCSAPYLGGPLAAMAGGLGVTLGGSVRYSADYAEEHQWIGPAGSSARLAVDDLERAAMLQYIFFLCLLGLHSALIILEI
jgi:adenosylcobinamide-phosphate synthase